MLSADFVNVLLPITRAIRKCRLSTFFARENDVYHFGLTAHRPYVGPPLTPRRRAVRMNWLQRHRPNHFSRQRWRLVLFSDESRFTLFRSDGRQRVYRRRGERFADACVLQRDRFGGGSLLVWGSIAYNFKSELVFIDGSLTALKYRDNVLVPHVIPAIRQRALTFQQDNARPHVAHICTDLLTENDIDVMDRPPYSPDLSPIEHLWDELDRRVRRRRNVPQKIRPDETGITRRVEQHSLSQNQ